MLKWNNEPTLEKQWYINWKSSWEKHKHPWQNSTWNHVKLLQESVQKTPAALNRSRYVQRVAYLRAQPTFDIRPHEAMRSIQTIHLHTSHQCNLTDAVISFSCHLCMAAIVTELKDTERLWPSVATATKWPSADAGKMASEAHASKWSECI